MAYTQLQLDALRTALASGVTRVSFEGRSMEYGSTQSLKEAIAIIEADLRSQAGTKKIRQIRIVANKGF